MTKSAYPFFSYLEYWLVQEDKYSLQSPSVYKIYTGLLSYMDRQADADLDLEKIRTALLNDGQMLEIEDFGAGSKKLTNKSRKTSSVTKYSTSGRRFSQLYQYFCRLSPSEKNLELGTCVGINSRYLARACTAGELYTFEGSEALYLKAQEHPKEPNTNYILGKLSDSLPEILRKIGKVDFALIDATHTYLGTRSYFDTILPYLTEKSVLAVADIHWSRAMGLAWQEIKKHPQVSLSLDFFECGIVFFDKSLPKESYVLKF
ncbi:O-methyltransferase [Belliella marina]|uniref:O-methyltransferase n=1 Tax=Belliella marina TaxID=1644146 RepID=A0ABW4VR55_9BACT